MTISRSTKLVSAALIGAFAIGTVSVAQAAPYLVYVDGQAPYVQDTPHIVKVNDGRHGAFIAGALGALALGAVIANQNHPYYAPVDTYDQPVYDSPPVVYEDDSYDAPVTVYRPRHRYYRYYDGY